MATTIVLTAALYFRVPPPGGHLFGWDFEQLHAQRIAFARQFLFGAGHELPAWNPRQALGAPFWSNIQSFPFIPTRLALLPLDPYARYSYTIAVATCAALAALFTYLFARKIRLHPLAALTAGWTFGSGGYFASRVLAGHLPLLEVYCGLPLMLWLIECLAQARRRDLRAMRWNITMCLAGACLLLGGHPQLPIYAFAATALFAWWRGSWSLMFLTVRNLMIGAGLAAFVLVPSTLLIGRSTRVLDLEPANNDLAMPMSRFMNFLLPWYDGAATIMARGKTNPFHGYQGQIAYFYDTFVYCGWLPLLTLSLLLIFPRLTKPRSQKTFRFLLVLGLIGIVFSTSIAKSISGLVPGTFLRSPARLLYLTEFTLAICLAIGVDYALRSRRVWLWTIVAVAIAYHAWDLCSVSREFLVSGRSESAAANAMIDRYIRQAGDGRVSFDDTIPSSRLSTADDIGFFDSIILARPYQWLLAVSRADPRMNVQAIHSSLFPVRALEAGGVKYVLSFHSGIPLPVVDHFGPMLVYENFHAAARARFYPWPSVQSVDSREIGDRLADNDYDAQSTLLLPSGVTIPKEGSASTTAEVTYQRPSPDRIYCAIRSDQSGVLRLLESFDPGWRATVDGQTIPIIPAMNALLAVPLPSGTHEIFFEYTTPGAAVGRVISLVTALGIVAWIIIRKRTRQPTATNSSN